MIANIAIETIVRLNSAAEVITKRRVYKGQHPLLAV